MAVKSTFLALCLLQATNADWTTTIKSTLTVPNSLTPVVDFVIPSPTLSTQVSTPTPLSFDQAQSHTEQFTSVVTVPAGKVPTVRFSSVEPSTSVPVIPKPSSVSPTSLPFSTPYVPPAQPQDTSSSLATAPASPQSVPQGAPSPSTSQVIVSPTPIVSTPSSSPVIPPGETGQTTPSGQASSNAVPPVSTVSTSSSSALISPGETGQSTSSSQASSSVVPPASNINSPSSSPTSPGETGQSTSFGQSSSNVVPPASTENVSGSSPVVPSSTSTDEPSTPSGTTSPVGTSSTISPQIPSTSAGQSTTSEQSSSELPDSQSPSPPTSTSDGSSTPTPAPSSQLTSADLESASDLESITADETDSDSAIGIYAPTATPTSEPWSTMTDLPSGTITGTAAQTEATYIAGLLKNSYNNIDDLKTDPKSYKQHIKDIEDRTGDYLSKTNFDSTKSPCSGSSLKKRGLGKRGLFDAIGNLASEAAGATVDTAKGIADAALSCVAPIADEMNDKIPDVSSGVTDDIQSQVTKGTQYFVEISNIVEDMDQKLKNEEDNQSSTSDSESESSTSSGSSTSSESSTSTTSSCTSSTTYSDCTWSTIISSTPGSTSATLTTTSTEICETHTACDASPTTTSTTTTISACPVRRYVVNPAAPVPVAPSGSTTGSFSAPTSTSSPTSAGSPGSTFTTSVAPSSRPPTTTTPSSTPTSTSGSSGTSQTTAAPSCQAYYYVGQKDSATYCQFDCDAYTGRYPIAKSTSGMSNYQPCPYSMPPSSTWSETNAGTFTTTATDGTVYYCGDSRYQNAVINDDKSCVTSMSSVTVISSIHSSWSVSKESAASSASSASSASEASASSASAASATPTDSIYIVYSHEAGSFSHYWKLFEFDETVDLCNTPALGTADADGDIGSDVPNPPTINFSDDAAVKNEEFKDCEYDGDNATLTCPDFSVECQTDVDSIMGTKNCQNSVIFGTTMVPKVYCPWGPADMKS
ncbi:hypothetical protein BDV18DRAFT_158863 [Aspergillus unguis]